MTLKQEVGAKTILSVHGEIAEYREVGSVIRHEVTFVWPISNRQESAECQVRKILSSYAKITSNRQDKTSKIRRRRISL